MSKPLMMHCIYRPTPGNEEPLFELLKKHWPALKSAGLVVGTVETLAPQTGPGVLSARVVVAQSLVAGAEAADDDRVDLKLQRLRQAP